ncbi:MAG TPA: DUF167 domain-containing protein [Candidatus Binatia bacterium]|jgi:hypothetical protein|nr:DUF167 domain-containing protein [Candidatus Binatia bacterium]
MARNVSVTVKPNAKLATITKLTDSEYRVTVHAPAEDGKANRALIELLARYFCVPKSAIRIVRGQFARKKLIEIGK